MAGDLRVPVPSDYQRSFHASALPVRIVRRRPPQALPRASAQVWGGARRFRLHEAVKKQPVRHDKGSVSPDAQFRRWAYS